MSAQPGQLPQYSAGLPATVTGPARKSWLRRNWLWLLGGLFLGGLLLVFGVIMLIFGAIRSSDVAKAAVARAQANPDVVQRLGSPLEEGFFVSGSVNVGGDTGDADLAIPISGPKGKGTIAVTARKIGGIWECSVLQVAINSTGEHIDLLPSAPSVSENQTQASQPQPTQSAVVPAAISTPVAQPAASEPAASTAPADAKPSSAAPSPSTSSSGVIQSQDTNTAGIVAEVIQAKRAEGVLTIKVRFRNTSNTAGHLTFIHWNAAGADNPKFYVTAANKKYFLLADTDGTTLSSNSSSSEVDVAPGNTFTWWGKYPAPSADVSKITFMTPLAPPFEDVPLSDK
jgi:hypothetical protein